ncbi:MAG TPA: amidophosphoribosyltransferase [Candidatus Sulfotelmatobacter sp.]|jgi:amidophosphoribosyltransferase|nr:amidophosphoribosyltransferase [Candidatus Sulfotelmatobacter sp.]
MCGFIGVIGAPDAVGEVYDGLLAIQHRGQDAAGIITYDGGRFHVKKGEGLVRDIFTAANMARLRGSLAVGHVRYPTVGSGGGEDAQPFTVNFPFGIAMAHNGNVANYEALKGELAQDALRILYSGCDVEVILNVFAGALARASQGTFSLEAYHAAVREVYATVRGAYSVVGFIAGHGLFAFRDPYGIKPIALGRRATPAGTCYAVASESVVLSAIDYELLPSGSPGEALFIDLDGNVSAVPVAPPNHHPCVFEFVYFARPDSYLEGISVYAARIRMGERLADRFRALGLSADVVIPIPDSARTAALAMAQAVGIPYREGLVKNRYVGRTFIMPSDGERRRSLRHKLNAIEEEFSGKDVLLVDDSIVRGNTSRQIVRLARSAGARRVLFASMSPPLVHPCVYGIDMSTRREFIARGRSHEEVAQEIGADAVIYQTLDDLVEAVRAGSPQIRTMCTACFSGSYPTGDITPQMLLQIEHERLTQAS